MIPYNGGIVCGTQGGEWMVAASTLTDPITPTSIQAHRRSKYKCANVQPIMPGFSTVFVQLEREKLIEYVADVFSTKLFGRNLNANSSHLTSEGLAQIAYQQERAPIIWVRRDDGALIGSTYRRDNAYPTEPPTFNGWHRHDLGSGRVVESLSVGPSVNGTLESLTVVTNQTGIEEPDLNVRHVEILTDMFEETADIYGAWFCDDALTPSAMQENTGLTQLTCYGYYHLAGKTVDGWIAGVDAGQAVVDAAGTVTFPVNAAGSLLTDARINTAMNSGEDYGGLGTYLDRTVNIQYPTLSGASIQSYNSVSAAGGYIDDYKGNRVFAIHDGVGTTGRITVFNRLTGAKILEKTADDIFGVGSSYSIDPGQANAVILGADGYLYFSCTLANIGPIVQVRASDLVMTGIFGVNGGTGNTNSSAFHIGKGVVLKIGSYSFLVFSGNAFAHLGVLQVGGGIGVGIQWAGHDFVYPDNVAAGVCEGETITTGGPGYTSAYSITAKASSLKIYKTTIGMGTLGQYTNPPSSSGANAARVNPGIQTAQVGAFAPASIDAGWTQFTSAEGIVYDPNDGNIIFCASSALASPVAYIVKMNPNTGAIVWKTSIPVFDGGNGPTMKMSLMGGSQIALLTTAAGSVTMRVYNTVGGANTSNTAIGSLNSGPMSSVSNDGSVVGVGTWNGTGLNGLNGTVTFSTRAYKLQGFAGFPGQITETQSGVIPAVIGFSYTTQGQRLRPVAPDASGARNGPALGKTSRVHRNNTLFVNSQGVSIGGTFDSLLPAKFTSPSAAKTALPLTTLFNGVHSMTIKDDYDYDSMTCWQISRPYPAAVASTGDNLETSDR